MSKKVGIIAAGALALAVPGVAAPEIAWSRATSPDHAFSVETPCSAEEIDRAKGLPPEIGDGITLPQASRVVCEKDGFLLVAGVVEEPALPKDGSSLFDQFTKSAGSDSTLEGKPRVATINGHRAWLNRQQQGDVVAQTGVIEVSRSTVILGVTGGNRSTLKPDAQIAMIDRFYGSIQVAAK